VALTAITTLLKVVRSDLLSGLFSAVWFPRRFARFGGASRFRQTVEVMVVWPARRADEHLLGHGEHETNRTVGHLLHITRGPFDADNVGPGGVAEAEMGDEDTSALLSAAG
jgi:hypothetical protein